MADEAHHILIVCTGNICRSPMAEYLLRNAAVLRGKRVEVKSASMIGLDGNPAHQNAVRAMKEVGIDIQDHRAQPCTEELAAWADWILGMEINHAAQLRERYPDADEKIMLLGTYGGLVEIDDPLGGWRWRFRTSRKDIQRCVDTFVERLPPQR